MGEERLVRLFREGGNQACLEFYAISSRTNLTYRTHSSGERILKSTGQTEENGFQDYGGFSMMSQLHASLSLCISIAVFALFYNMNSSMAPGSILALGHDSWSIHATQVYLF